VTEAAIVGWAHTRFGKLEDPDAESLIGRVARAAIEDAGIAPGDVGAISRADVGGVFNMSGAGVASYVSILESMRG
jgi:acetyl-CoA C-acetyltransferase